MCPVRNCFVSGSFCGVLLGYLFTNVADNTYVINL